MKTRTYLAFFYLSLSAPAFSAVLVADPSTGIQSMVSAATNGDEIQVQPGVYKEQITIFGKSITLVSVKGPITTIIDGDGGTAVNISGPSTIKGFTITGGKSYSGAGVTVGGAGALIQNNIFDGNQQFDGGSGAAIGGSNASPIIDRNLFRNNSSDMQFSSGVVAFSNASHPVIINNIFENNNSRAINLIMPSGSYAYIQNNTIVNNLVGIYVPNNTSARAIRILNNIVVGNEVGIDFDYGLSWNNAVFEHNLIWDNDVDYKGTSNLTGINGNISVDPVFKNARYELSNSSPAIDSGIADYANYYDYLGKNRTRDGNKDKIATIDMGAYEAGSINWLMMSAFGIFAICRRKKIRQHINAK